MLHRFAEDVKHVCKLLLLSIIEEYIHEFLTVQSETFLEL